MQSPTPLDSRREIHRAAFAIATATNVARADPHNAEKAQAVIDARRYLEFLTAERAVTNVVKAAPALTDAQRARLAFLIGGGSS